MTAAADKSWQREFEDPITLPDGRTIITLEDAARYIQRLPNKERDLPHWQTATLTLINAAEGFMARVRSISTAYPQGRFLGCASVHMGLLRNRSQADCKGSKIGGR